MADKNVLWVQNCCTADVILGDLNVKICVGRTVNIYRINSSLTAERVEKSLESGSLFKRFKSKVLRQVTGPVETRPATLDQLKTAKGTIVARKTKTSIVIDPNQPDEEEGIEKKGFDFADYGVSDVAKPTKGENGSVILNANQDETVKPPLVSPTSKNIIEDLRKKASNPMGPIAKMNQPNNAPFVVVDNRPAATPEPVKEKPPVVKSSPQDELPVPQTATKTNNGMVIVGGEEPARSIQAIAKGTQDTEVIPNDDISGADKVIDGLKDDEGMRIATKTKEGVVIMKTVDETEEKPVKKVKAKKT